MSVPRRAKIEVLASATTWAFDRMSGRGESHGSIEALSPLIGQPAPDFDLSSLSGDRIELASRKGEKVVVLDFWATWCRPCIRALPEVQAAVDAHAGRGVELIAINQAESPGKVSGFLRTRGWKLQVALDAEEKVRDLYGVTGIPTTFIIGKDGKVHSMHQGYSPGLADRLKESIAAALEGKP